MTSPTKRDIMKWINALRSGEFSQTTGRLQTSEGHCCLGVACALFIPKEKLIYNQLFIRGELPSGQEHAPTWLAEINDKFDAAVTLSCLNDQERLTFDEIADCLQAVYIEGALEGEE